MQQAMGRTNYLQRVGAEVGLVQELDVPVG
jgi:hypothetical protein